MSVISTDSLYDDLGLTRAPTNEAPSSELDADDFMNLMITELQYQDPFEPMDNAQMASQFADFSTVSGLDTLNDSFASLGRSLLSNRTMQAAALVGREVVVPGNTGQLETGGALRGVIELDHSATNVIASIYGSNGELVRELNLGTQAAGDVAFNWDGMNENGEYAAAGQYQVLVSALVGGARVSPATRMAAPVDSVELNGSGGAVILNVRGQGQVLLDNVSEIA
jgi:flagellar basal-body rod modification protein FlgD